MKKTFYEDNIKYIDQSYDSLLLKSSKPEEQGVDGELLKKGEQELANEPSVLGFIVMRRGQIIWERYFNGGEPNYSYNIHSASKGMISALVGIALEKGFIKNLDEKIYQLLPEYTFKDEEKKNITLRHLLSMTAGFTWKEDETEYTLEKNDDWIQAVIDLPLETVPGKRFNYCTGLTHLLSAILTKSTGMTTFDFAKKYLFDPIRITVEHWGQDPKGYYSGGYNVYMTPRELATFAQLYLDQGKKEGNQIVPEEWIKESFATHSHVDATYGYGYLWWLRSFKRIKTFMLWGHGGQFGYVIPELDTIVVITTDTSEEYKELNGDRIISQYVIPAIKKTD